MIRVFIFVIGILLLANISYADRNIEIPPNLGENPPPKYIKKKTKSSNADVTATTDNVKNKVANILSDKGSEHSVKKANIKNRLDRLSKRIASKKYNLKLKQKARKNALKDESSRVKKNIKKKAKIKRKTLRRIIGTTTMN